MMQNDSINRKNVPYWAVHVLSKYAPEFIHVDSVEFLISGRLAEGGEVSCLRVGAMRRYLPDQVTSSRISGIPLGLLEQLGHVLRVNVEREPNLHSNQSENPESGTP